MASKLQKWADETVEAVLEGEKSINEAIDEFDKRLEVYDYVKGKRDQLTAARRSLLGVGSRTTSSGGSRVTQDEVAKIMSDNDGATVSMIARSLSGATESQVRSHLNRGRHQRFLKRESDNYWFLRDPEKGWNNESDLPPDAQ